MNAPSDKTNGNQPRERHGSNKLGRESKADRTIGNTHSGPIKPQKPVGKIHG